MVSMARMKGADLITEYVGKRYLPETMPAK
jgi:hypothetical protein